MIGKAKTRTVKKVIKSLNKASKAHASQERLKKVLGFKKK